MVNTSFFMLALWLMFDAYPLAISHGYGETCILCVYLYIYMSKLQYIIYLN